MAQSHLRCEPARCGAQRGRSDLEGLSRSRGQRQSLRAARSRPFGRVSPIRPRLAHSAVSRPFGCVSPIRKPIRTVCSHMGTATASTQPMPGHFLASVSPIRLCCRDESVRWSAATAARRRCPRHRPGERRLRAAPCEKRGAPQGRDPREREDEHRPRISASLTAREASERAAVEADTIWPEAARLAAGRGPPGRLPRQTSSCGRATPATAARRGSMPLHRSEPGTGAATDRARPSGGGQSLAAIRRISPATASVGRDASTMASPGIRRIHLRWYAA